MRKIAEIATIKDAHVTLDPLTAILNSHNHELVRLKPLLQHHFASIYPSKNNNDREENVPK